MEEPNDETLIGIETSSDTPRPWARPRIFWLSTLYALGWAALLLATLSRDEQMAAWVLMGGLMGCVFIPAVSGTCTKLYLRCRPGRIVTLRGATWIAAADVEACSTARLDDGRVSIALSTRSYDPF